MFESLSNHSTLPGHRAVLRILAGQEIQPDQKERVDAAVPRKAPAKPKQPRRMLVTNLSMRDGKPVRGSSAAAIPLGTTPSSRWER